jgi:hypothetical protein
VRREDDDRRRSRKSVIAFDDLFLESGVAGADPFVHHQDVIAEGVVAAKANRIAMPCE